jgi:BioD-like phosphotransacetylase family protein
MLAANNDLVIIEGTGHAGVGSVIDLSNAAVARLLNANVVLISSGGIGKPIDEICLNTALFEKERVRLAGVVINKVLPDKYDKVSKIVRLGLEKKGLTLLGILPYQRILDTPTVRELNEELKIELLFGEDNIDVQIEKILVCAMMVRDALQYIKDRTLIITPGDREDIIQAVIKLHLDKRTKKGIAGIILSGGIYPSRKIEALMGKAQIPVLITSEDTYAIASRVHGLKVKLKPQDAIKIKTIINMVETHVDIESVLKNIT